jgi:hypothetical protein
MERQRRRRRYTANASIAPPNWPAQLTEHLSLTGQSRPAPRPRGVFSSPRVVAGTELCGQRAPRGRLPARLVGRRPAKAHRPTEASRQSRLRCLATGCYGLARAGRRMRVEGHRDGPLHHRGGLRKPCGPPARRPCGLPVPLPHDLGEHGAASAIHDFPSTSVGVPKSIPPLAQTAPGTPTNRPESHRSGPRPRGVSRAPPRSWSGPIGR